MARPWWRSAAFYQIYVRSFQDSNGDGVGDLQGIRSRLPYLQELGVDALWLTPFYPSPQADHGYDVADYADVDPLFGTLADFDELLADAHELGIKVTIDIVPNHTSDQHEWFRNAIADPAHPDRKRYMFRPGRNGGPPNGWTSAFGGPAWTLDEQTGEYYLHFFTPEQPDLDWHHEAVQDSFDEILRFWLDRGVDGFRIDVAHALFKAQDLPRDGRADAAAALRRLALGADAARAAPALPPLAPDRRRVPRRPDVCQRDHDREPGHDRELRRAGPAAPLLRLHAPARAVGRRADASDDRPRPDDARRRRRARDLGLREPRRDAAADPLRRRRARAAARPRRGAPALRPAGRGVHLRGPGARARGGRRPGRGAPGSDLPPHRRRTEGPRRLPRADPLDDGAADVRLHRRRAVAADARGLGAAQRRGAGAATPTRRSRSSAPRSGCGPGTTGSPGARARGGR